MFRRDEAGMLSGEGEGNVERRTTRRACWTWRRRARSRRACWLQTTRARVPKLDRSRPVHSDPTRWLYGAGTLHLPSTPSVCTVASSTASHSSCYSILTHHSSHTHSSLESLITCSTALNSACYSTLTQHHLAHTPPFHTDSSLHSILAAPPLSSATAIHHRHQHSSLAALSCTTTLMTPAHAMSQPCYTALNQLTTPQDYFSTPPIHMQPSFHSTSLLLQHTSFTQHSTALDTPPC